MNINNQINERTEQATSDRRIAAHLQACLRLEIQDDRFSSTNLAGEAVNAVQSIFRPECVLSFTYHGKLTLLTRTH